MNARTGERIRSDGEGRDVRLDQSIAVQEAVVPDHAAQTVVAPVLSPFAGQIRAHNLAPAQAVAPPQRSIHFRMHNEIMVPGTHT